MEKLNGKYVEWVVKKAEVGKIVAVHGEKLWNTAKLRKGGRRGAQKGKSEGRHGSRGRITRGKEW